ncbi:MAG: family 78 glycoside hydrolase catalytic domain, partial [Clostridiales bacterium]|nr:family 78 glycoside hydrolase catalytic domain [Clostridiales bacterium]
MSSIFSAEWIKSARDIGDVCPVFFRDFTLKGEVKSAVLMISALGVYEAKINGQRVGDFIFAPGWTSYKLRVQFQSYDVASLLSKSNLIEIGAGIGWRFHARKDEVFKGLGSVESAVIAVLTVDYADGSQDTVMTGADWLVKESAVRYSNMYNGETFDANFVTSECWSAKVVPVGKDILLPQQGEEVHEMCRIPAREIITTPKGETVIDFGQNMTGYVEFSIKGNKGERAIIHHAEVLDRDGNFYTDNYRSAKNEICFICDGNEHVFKPRYSFQGFRYIRLEGFSDDIRLENFTGIAVFSNMKRIGRFECSDEMINKLYENIIWGQRGNFLDVPTDCPQRDERLGWTGDAQVFVRTASFNYDVERFFSKWLADLAVDQDNDGPVPHIVPKIWEGYASAAWADAAIIVPWQIYLTYG